MKIRILLADDEQAFRETLTSFLREEGMDVQEAADGTAAIRAIDTTQYDIIILDIQMPGADGITVLRHAANSQPRARIIMITAYGTVEMAVEAIKLGGCDYVTKPVIFDDILLKIRQQFQYQRLQEENLELRQELHGDFSVDNIIGSSAVMQSVFETIHKVARARSNVLITGESGTGKELVARAIHALGPTVGHRFVAVNCSAIPEGLLESELFGHRKGSFTSATQDKKGYFETANGGTLFLDEIGYMPPNCQVKLLRAVEDRRITPIGSTEAIQVSLRLITATNKVLANEIKRGRFREDLYYRINVVGIHLPPLSQRREDIPQLVDHFVRKYSAELGKVCRGVTAESMNALMSHEWKGNVRELQNVIERAIIFAEEDLITLPDIGIIGQRIAGPTGNGDNLYTAMRIYEREHIRHVLEKHNGSKAETARALGIGLSSLYRKVDELDIKTANGSRSSSGDSSGED